MPKHLSPLTVWVIWHVMLMIPAMSAVAETGRDPFRLPPVPTISPTPAAAKAPSPAHLLIGVVLSDGQAAAIFRNVQDNQLKVVRAGEKIDHRFVKRIDLNGVVYDKE